MAEFQETGQEPMEGKNVVDLQNTGRKWSLILNTIVNTIDNILPVDI